MLFANCQTGERSLYFPTGIALSGRLLNEILQENFIITMMVKKKILEQAGDFNEQAWSRGIDITYGYELRQVHKEFFCLKALAVYYDMPSTSIQNAHIFNYFGLSLLRTEKQPPSLVCLLKASRDVLLDRKITYLNCAARSGAENPFFTGGMLEYKIFAVLKSRENYIYENPRYCNSIPPVWAARRKL